MKKKKSTTPSEAPGMETTQFPYQAAWNLATLIIRHPLPLTLGLSLILISTACALLEPRLFGQAIDEAITPKDLTRLKEFAVIYFFVTATRVICTIKETYFIEVLGQNVAQDLRARVYSHLQRMPIAGFDQTHAGRLMTRVTNDIAAINEMFTAGFVTVICNVLLLIGIFIALFSINFRLALISSSVFPILCVMIFYFSRVLKKAYTEARNRLSALNAFLAENLAGMRVIHVFNRQASRRDQFNQFNLQYTLAQVGTIRAFALFQPAITIASGFSVALILWFGGISAYDGSLKIGGLVTIFSYMLSLFQPVREIADKWNVFLSGIASAERIFSVLDLPVELTPEQTSQPALPLPSVQGKIVFENVWFAYPSTLAESQADSTVDADHQEWVLKDFSLEIRPGESIAVVGHTAAGKSTLMSLLLRFYDPQKGRILLDGKDLRDYDLRNLRTTFGLVQQDLFLFSGTLLENVDFFSNPDEKRTAEIETLLRSLGLKRDLNELLEERASNLSVGERQVISFARTLIRHPSVWILDEATANIDFETEARIQEAFLESAKGKTSIMIAHHVSAVRDTNRIIVLQKGVLVESGTHAELLQKGGFYAALCRFEPVSSISFL